MAERGGILLEKNIDLIFSTAGFDVIRNAERSGYEIDVLAKAGDKKIIIECKQREKSNINVKNLIHQWSGKNKEIEAQKVILALYGVSITAEHYELAEEKNILLWTSEDIEELLDNVKDGDLNKSTLLTEIGLESQKSNTSASKQSELTIGEGIPYEPPWRSIQETIQKEFPSQPFDTVQPLMDSKFKVYGFYDSIGWDEEVKVLEEYANKIDFRHVKKAVEKAKRKKDINTLLIVPAPYSNDRNQKFYEISPPWVQVAEKCGIKCLIGLYEPKKEKKFGLFPTDKESQESLRNQSIVQIYSVEEAWQK